MGGTRVLSCTILCVVIRRLLVVCIQTTLPSSAHVKLLAAE